MRLRCSFIGFSVVLLLVVAGCGSERASFDQGSLDEITSALQGQELAICTTVERDSDKVPGADSKQRLDVALPSCAGSDEEGAVTVTSYSSEEARDRAVTDFETATRPTSAHGAVWTYAQFTIHISRGSDQEIDDRFTDAMEELGAK